MPTMMSNTNSAGSMILHALSTPFWMPPKMIIKQIAVKMIVPTRGARGLEINAPNAEPSSELSGSATTLYA